MTNLPTEPSYFVAQAMAIREWNRIRSDIQVSQHMMMPEWKALSALQRDTICQRWKEDLAEAYRLEIAEQSYNESDA